MNQEIAAGFEYIDRQSGFINKEGLRTHAASTLKDAFHKINDQRFNFIGGETHQRLISQVEGDTEEQAKLRRSLNVIHKLGENALAWHRDNFASDKVFEDRINEKAGEYAGDRHDEAFYYEGLNNRADQALAAAQVFNGYAERVAILTAEKPEDVDQTEWDNQVRQRIIELGAANLDVEINNRAEEIYRVRTTPVEPQSEIPTPSDPSEPTQVAELGEQAQAIIEDDAQRVSEGEPEQRAEQPGEQEPQAEAEAEAEAHEDHEEPAPEPVEPQVQALDEFTVEPGEYQRVLDELNAARDEYALAKKTNRSAVRSTLHNVRAAFNKIGGRLRRVFRRGQSNQTEQRNPGAEWAKTNTEIAWRKYNEAKNKWAALNNRRAHGNNREAFAAGVAEDFDKETQALAKREMDLNDQHWYHRPMRWWMDDKRALVRFGVFWGLNLAILGTAAIGAVPVAGALFGVRAGLGTLGTEGGIHKLQNFLSLRKGARSVPQSSEIHPELGHREYHSATGEIDKYEAARRMGSWYEYRVRNRIEDQNELERSLRARYRERMAADLAARLDGVSTMQAEQILDADLEGRVEDPIDVTTDFNDSSMRWERHANLLRGLLAIAPSIWATSHIDKLLYGSKPNINLPKVGWGNPIDWFRDHIPHFGIIPSDWHLPWEAPKPKIPIHSYVFSGEDPISPNKDLSFLQGRAEAQVGVVDWNIAHPDQQLNIETLKPHDGPLKQAVEYAQGADSEFQTKVDNIMKFDKAYSDGHVIDVNGQTMVKHGVTNPLIEPADISKFIGN